MSEPTFFEWMKAHPADAKRIHNEWTRYALSLARGRCSDADDLVQECMRRVGGERCPEFPGRYGRRTILRLHLNKIKRNAVHKKHKKSLQYLFDLCTRSDSGARRAEARRLLQRIASVHSKISNFDMLLDRATGMSNRDLARRYECTEATARQRIHRARVQLLRVLEGRLGQ